MKLTVEYDAELQKPRATLVAESQTEERDLQLLAAFEDVRFSYEIETEAGAPTDELAKFKQAANLLIDYCEAHEWGLMPEPFDSINPLLALLGRAGAPEPQEPVRKVQGSGMHRSRQGKL